MGLLTHLFGKKKDIAKELVMDDNKRLALWNKYISIYTTKDLLSRAFSFTNIDRAVRDFEATKQVLEKIESLISPELVNINDEEKLDAEILADLERLKSTAEIEGITWTLVYEKKKQVALLAVFREIHDLLKTELHLIQLIRQKPSNVKELLLRLFKLIIHNEALLCKPFIKEFYFDKSAHARIAKLAEAVILEEEIKEEIETDEEKFVKEMVKKMGLEESKHRYRKLAEDIYYELAERAGAPLGMKGDIIKGIERLEKLMKDDACMLSIVKKLRPKYDDVKIQAVILAFRKAYDLGHFMELEALFVT